MKKQINAKTKVKIIECAETYGIERASEYYEVEKYLILKWITKKEKIIQTSKDRSEYGKKYIKNRHAEGKLVSNGKKYKRTYRPFSKMLKNLKSNLRKKEVIHEVPTAKDLCLLAYKQRLICPYSGIKLNRENMSIDHIIPLSKGGTSNINNLCIVDKRINIMKSTMGVEEFINLCKIISQHNK